MATTTQQLALYTEAERKSVAGNWSNVDHERASRLLRRLKRKFGTRKRDFFGVVYINPR